MATHGISVFCCNSGGAAADEGVLHKPLGNGANAMFGEHNLEWRWMAVTSLLINLPDIALRICLRSQFKFCSGDQVADLVIWQEIL